MRWFLNLTTQAKLLSSFSLMIVLIGLCGLTTHQVLQTAQTNQRRMQQDEFRSSMLAMEIRTLQNNVRVRTLQLLLLGDPKRDAPLRRRISDSLARIDQAIAELLAIETRQKDQASIELVRRAEQALVEYREARIGFIAMVDAGSVQEARHAAITIQADRFDLVHELLTKVVQKTEADTQLAGKQAEQQLQDVYKVFAVLATGSILLAIAMAMALSRQIAKPLEEASKLAERVASGDLSVNMSKEDRHDEVGILRRSLVKMVCEMRNVQGELKTGVEVLASSSREILATVSQVAAGASQTAAAVNETGTTAYQVRHTAQLTNEKAVHVREAARQAANVSEMGRQAVEETVEGMNHLRTQMESIAERVARMSDHSQSIGEIIATVGELAEQSNLLAVNASIEATRAGEYGKSFAVVAQEVKVLAEQSRHATKQVRSILMEIQKATSAAVMASEQGSRVMAAGIKQAADAGESIGSLALGVQEASDAASQIAASSQQQLAGMDQIAMAIDNIKRASSENLTGTRQLEVSARELEQMGSRLKNLVAKWRI